MPVLNIVLAGVVMGLSLLLRLLLGSCCCYSYCCNWMLLMYVGVTIVMTMFV